MVRPEGKCFFTGKLSLFVYDIKYMIYFWNKSKRLTHKRHKFPAASGESEHIKFSIVGLMTSERYTTTTVGLTD